MKTPKIIRRQRGFTIIEVMIVLSIAALIMLIVFLAVPALQRNARNNQRDSDASKIAAAVNECLSNNNGTIANCMPTSPNTETAKNPAVDVNNPASNGDLIVGTKGTFNLSSIQQLTTVTLYAPGASLPSLPNDAATAYIFPGYTCGSNNDPTNTGAGANQFAVWYHKESAHSGTYIDKCIGS